MAESTASLRAEIKALSGVDIMLDSQNFKSTYQIMDELSQKWEDLSDIAQASIIELVAGKHQGNVMASLMSNFDTARNALETSLTSSGSAMAEHAKWQKSLEAQLNKLSAAWQGLSQAFLSSDFLKVALDGVINLIDGLTKLIDTFGAIPTFAVAFGAFKSLTGNGLFASFNKELTGFTNQLSLFGKSLHQIGIDLKQFKQNVTQVFASLKSEQSFKQALESISGQFSFDAGFDSTLAADKSALEAYKAAVQGGMSVQDAFAQEMRESSAEAQYYAQTMNAASIDVSKFETIARQSQITEQAKSFKNAGGLIKEYNGGLQTCGLQQKEFFEAINKSNKDLSKYLSGVKQGNASLGKYIISLVGAKIGTIALEVATLALNTAITMGVSLIVTGLVSAITSFINKEKELAEEVKEVTSAFKEQYSELQKLKGDYDTDNESSMISKYEKLSKGVGNYNENISLTSEEYSEYLNIVDKIADQFPTLIQGYDDTGTALLSCKDDVKALANEYEDLIYKQNQAILTGENGEKIQDNWKNVLSQARGYDIWEDLGNDLSFDGLFGGKLENWDMKLNTARWLGSLTKETSKEEIEQYLNDVANPRAYQEIIQALQYDYDVNAYTGKSGLAEVIKEALETEPEKIREILNNYYAGFDEAVAEYKTKATALLSNAFNVRSEKTGLNYNNISDELQNIAYQVVNGLDFNFLNNLDAQGMTIEQWVTNMLDQLNALDDEANKTIETGFELRTKFNGGDISYGQYIGHLQETIDFIDSKAFDVSDEVKKQIKLSLNSEDILADYNALVHDLKEIGLDDTSINDFTNGLSSEELSIVLDVVPEFDPMSDSKIKEQLDRYGEGGNVNLTLRPEVDTSVLKKAGWEDAGEGAATVFTSTFSNEAGNVAMNFTPIIVDENGNHIGTLSPEDLQAYAEGVIAGTREDDFNLQIGAKFEGKNAIAEAENAAEYIHKLQDYYYNGTSAQLNDAIERAMAINGLLTDFNIEVETTGIETLNTALAESKSATGLTVESIDALKARYKDLGSYNAATLFEETANGIRINSTELAKLEKEYKKLNKQDLDETLEKLVDEYNELTVEINNCQDASKRADLYAQRDSILEQINDTATLAAQYKGLTSAYNEWQSAQEAGQDRDMYESVLSGREEIEDEMSRGWLDDAAIEYLELLTGKELSTAGIDAQIAAYKELGNTIEGTNYSVWDFFTEDEDGNATSDGVLNFFEAVKEASDGTAAYLKDGKYHFNFEGFEHNGKTGDAAIAEILGTSEELVQIMLKAAEDAGFVVNIKGEYTDLANLKEEAEIANDRMKELEATTYTFNFDSTDINDLNEQISEAETMLSNLKNEDGTLKVDVSEEDYRQAQDMLAALIYQKQSLDDSAILHVDTSQAKSDIENAILKLQEFRQYTNTLELETAIGADTSEATTNIQSVVDYINGLDTTIKAGLGLDTEEVQAAINNIQGVDIEAGVAIKQEDLDVINAAISSISNDMMVEVGLNDELIDNYKKTEHTAKGTVNWDNNIKAVTDWINQTHEASGTVKWGNNTDNVKKTFFGNGVINWTVSEANGTANANGTAFANGTIGGRAFKQGDWGIKGSGTALGGELGTEILVRDGRWYTIGDNGAEFFNYRKGDIIFNHRQAEELLSNGKVTSGGGRGKALAEGTAFAIGSNAIGAGRGFIKQAVTKDGEIDITTTTKSDKNGITVNNTIKGTDAVGGDPNAIKDAITESSSSSSEKEFEESFDWIEVAISRIERAIDQLDQKANNVYKSWSERNSALASEINEVAKEIELQESAAQRYLQEANSVGLSSSYAEMVRNGTINIEDFKGEGDEALVEKIKDYQEW